MTILAKIDERARAKASYDPPVRHKRYDKKSKKRQRRIKAKDDEIQSTRITKDGEERKVTFVAHPQFVELSHNFIRWPLARSEAFELKWKKSIKDPRQHYSPLLKDANGKTAINLFISSKIVDHDLLLDRAPRCSDMDLLYHLMAITKIAQREHRHDVAMCAGKKEMEKKWGNKRATAAMAKYSNVSIHHVNVGEVSLKFRSANAMLRLLGRTMDGEAHDQLLQNIAYLRYISVEFKRWLSQDGKDFSQTGGFKRFNEPNRQGPKKFPTFIHSLKWKENRGPISITVSKQLMGTIDEGQYNRVKLPLPKRSEHLCNLYILAPLLANLPHDKCWKMETLCHRLGIRFDNKHNPWMLLQKTVDQLNRHKDTAIQYRLRLYRDDRVGLYSFLGKRPGKTT